MSAEAFLILPAAALGWAIGLALADGPSVGRTLRRTATVAWIVFPIAVFVAFALRMQGCSPTPSAVLDALAGWVFGGGFAALGFATGVHARAWVRNVFIAFGLAVALLVVSVVVFLGVTITATPWLWLGECPPTASFVREM